MYSYYVLNRPIFISGSIHERFGWFPTSKISDTLEFPFPNRAQHWTMSTENREFIHISLGDHNLVLVILINFNNDEYELIKVVNLITAVVELKRKTYR